MSLQKMEQAPLDVDQIVQKMNLLPHPEGGYYKEIYRSASLISENELIPHFSGARSFCTSIYFLLTSANFSAFHRIKQDEIWHFYAGSPLTVHVIYPDGSYVAHRVGMQLDSNIEPQLVVPAGCWFASTVEEVDGYAFVGCTVAPGFDFEDFELANRADLTTIYPQHAEIIARLTRF